MQCKTLLLLFFVCHSLVVNSQSINGFAVENNNAYFVVDKTIYKKDILKNEVKIKKDLSRDTSIANQLWGIIKKTYSLKSDTVSILTKENIKKFKVQNLTFYKGFLYIGVSFYLDKKKDRKIHYAIVQADSNFNCKNLYYFKLSQKFKFFTLPSYYPLNFVDEQTIILPIYVDTAIFLYRFTLNSKLKKAIPQTAITGKISILKWATYDSETSLILTPLIYPVLGSSIGYFQYPMPLIKRIDNKSIDPYNCQVQIDSINRLKSFNRIESVTSIVNSENMNTLFKTRVVYVFELKDTLFMLSLSSNGLEMFKYNLKTSEFQIKALNIETNEDAFYLTDGVYIYKLSDIGSNNVIDRCSIQTLIKEGD